MGVNKAFLYWGVFFVAMGAVMVAVDLNGIDDTLVGQVASLWPVVVIALGIGLVLRQTRFSLVGGMLAAAIPGLMLGGVMATGPRLATSCGGGQPATFSQQQGVFSGPASVDVTLSCGELAVNTGPGQGWQLQAGNTEGQPARVDSSANALSVFSGRRGGWLGFNRGRDVWRLTLPASDALGLRVDVNAGQGRLDMAGAQLGDLDLAVNAAEARVDLTSASLTHLSAKLNAGKTSLRLPAGDDFDGAISVNAGSFEICAPEELGLQIASTATLGSATYPGLVPNGTTWQSPNYATASHHAELTVTVNVGSVNLNPVGGCQ